MQPSPPDIPAGWYHGAGDPPGTVRYWDGARWVGGPALAGGGIGVAGTQSSALGAGIPSAWSRLGARILDLMIFAVTAGILTRALSGDRTAAAYTATVLFLLYEIGFTAVKGATFGKMAFGLAVTDKNGASPPNLARSVGRVLAGFIPGVWVISLVLIFADARRRTVQDHIVGTHVDNNNPV